MLITKLFAGSTVQGTSPKPANPQITGNQSRDGQTKEKQSTPTSPSMCCTKSLWCHMITIVFVLVFFFVVLLVSSVVLGLYMKYEESSICHGSIRYVEISCKGLENCTSLVNKEGILINNSSLYNCTQATNATLNCAFCVKHFAAINPYLIGMLAILGFFCLGCFIFMGIHCGSEGTCCEAFCSSFKSLFQLFVIAFFYPLPVSDDNKSEWKVELIPVKFIAWEYAGCDTLWAGIITCLCDNLEARFGQYRSRYFRKIKGDYKNHVEPMLQGKQFYPSGYMRPYRCCFIPKFIWVLAVVLFIPLAIVVVSFYIDVQSIETSEELAKAIALGIFGSGVTLTFLLSVIKLLLFLRKSTKSYIENLQREMSRPDFKEELGFMHLVKQEVQLLNELIAYMENLERKHFRIVLLVDDLDRCEKRKVLKMLEAVSILLSEPRTRFISLIAVDPRVVVKSLELTVDVIMQDSRINGHEYLKKIIHLPFWLPEMDDCKVKKLVESYMPLEESMPQETPPGDQKENKKDKKSPAVPSTSSGKKQSQTPKNEIEMVDIEPQEGNKEENKDLKTEKKAEAGDAFKKALQVIHDKPEHICHNPRSIKRICNVLNMAMRLYVSKRTSATDHHIKGLVKSTVLNLFCIN